MVPWNVHKQVALLVVEAYQKFILGKNLGSVIMEGVKQVLKTRNIDKNWRPSSWTGFLV